ncbi:hypothetical protein TPHA_0M00360 [Tetrapisispora phaffii CBS 4417]|uniref:tRNA pseudouridine(32) synthase n=1 Tax=Tetrapisispora phaffii (strain ATCC 24235 / CBS 4417 / NBRC 1672 / NRRL Y-8282 / UCD 70-5) TaxID=1071381 RepID=G8C0V0_TETPH|nr:hypothetical protein TPHA_0M00360 [Tetrapisispora phaffii CBS 4417]CCE65611.1 hypothetical protein TPHA_0M00360 [Tetrapisispora phaffii CBS 4417]
MLTRFQRQLVTIKHYNLMTIKREMSSSNNEIDEGNSNTDSQSTSELSEFETYLLHDKARARQEKLFKQINQNKRAKRDNSKITQTELRDKAGFKLKVANTNSNRNKQEDPEFEVRIEGPLRKITPYLFTYKTFCKLRWRDRKLIDVFVNEFRDREESYYIKTIAAGKVFLNNEPANLDSVIRNGDYITHQIHRHEPPITSRPIKTVFENDDILAIDKPSGIAVHPTGRFRFNTITKILRKKLGYSVHPCNRLDRLTSGLMFLAKTPKGADEMGDQLKAREVTKEYIARVVGEFPIEETVVELPLRSIDPRVSLNAVCKGNDENAKHAKTIFSRISYDGKTSVVKCKPLTGRTHQIRVHLQYLGHPIANDPIYSNPSIWGPLLGKGGVEDYKEIADKLDEIGKTKVAESWFFSDAEGEKLLPDQKCEVCETTLYSDPGPNDLDLWLHAYRYESTELNEYGEKKWSYRTDFPDWAVEPNVKYMKMALEEARKCGPTRTAFNVGAVLVNGTTILSTGYSRELPGNTHAEQCALEKYFEKNNTKVVPEGTSIFTTVEPCSLRLSGNEACLERIINQNGNIRTVFVGTMEPNIFVKNNKSLTNLTKNNIEYVKIPGFEEDCLQVATIGHEN